MLYNYLLFFLGFKSWKYKSNNIFEQFLAQKKINLELLPPYQNSNKLINSEELDSNSPNLSFYLNIIDLRIKNKIIYS